MLVAGAGAWGTALAILLARNGQPAVLWGRDPEHIARLRKERCNVRFLPDIPFPDSLELSADLEGSLPRASDILIAVPSNAFREFLIRIRPLLASDARLFWATKGLEHGTCFLLDQVVIEVLGDNLPMAAISGPTFAAEIAAGLPAAMTVVANEPGYAQVLTAMLRNDSFRVYTSTDMIGVQVGAAAKNIIAIAAGIADGLGFGANTRAALVTRGLREIVRLGAALGGRRETFMGLTGLGDLMLTCTDNQSRNRRFGYALAQGRNTKDALAEIGQVVEGRLVVHQVVSLARKLGIEMPISEQVDQVLQGVCTPKEAVYTLLSREPKQEDA
ncbi:MAG: NAD(P)-dependent glycerol-3-phosphate dehydrogenase [Gammaproteobacteria bacterium]|nr:NAD(P)-dependent glycerol-3-phosphate dehydrogenase [Gammaproteobacteria bacterium]